MATPGVEAVVFESAVEGLGRSFRARLPAAALEELRRLGIDFDRLQSAYPREAWDNALRLVARTLYPGEPDARAWQRLGREFIDGYTQTMVGRAIATLGRAVGPKRFLDRLGRSFRSAGNFASITVEHPGPGECVITSTLEPEFLAGWVGRETAMHHYRLGVIEGGLAVIGAQGEVTLLGIDLERQVARYRATWR